MKVDPALLCQSPASIKGLPRSSKHSSLKCGCRYENCSVNTTQFYVSTHVGVQNMSDNVFSCSGMSTNPLVFSAWLWDWSGWEGFCFFFSSHLTNLPICCHHLLHSGCSRNPSFIACFHCWLFFGGLGAFFVCGEFFVWFGFCLFFNFYFIYLFLKLFRFWFFFFLFVQDPEASQGLAQMILDGLTETMGNPAFVWGAARRQITLQICDNAASAPGFSESPTGTSAKVGRSNCELSYFHLLVKAVKFFVDILTNNASEIYFPQHPTPAFLHKCKKPTTTQHAGLKLTKRREQECMFHPSRRVIMKKWDKK